MRLVIPQTHFLEASAVLRMSKPPLQNQHEGLLGVFANMKHATWQSASSEVIVVSNREHLVSSIIDFWIKPSATIKATEALAALALTSAMLPNVIAHLACHTTPKDRKADAMKRLAQMAAGLNLPQKIIKLYMIAGGHKGAPAETALGGALVRWLGLEASAWKEIRVSVDNLGLSPEMCVTVARHFFETGNYEEAGALLLSEMENIAIADVAEPGFVEAATASSVGVVGPPEIFKAAAFISKMLPLVGCDISHRTKRMRDLKGWLASRDAKANGSATIDGIVVDREAAEMCYKAIYHPDATDDIPLGIALRCVHSIAA